MLSPESTVFSRREEYLFGKGLSLFSFMECYPIIVTILVNHEIISNPSFKVGNIEHRSLTNTVLKLIQTSYLPKHQLFPVLHQMRTHPQ